MDTATKTAMDAAKTASKRVVQKTAEATGGLIGNKIADKITSIGKPKEKENHCIKMEFQKPADFLDTSSNDRELLRFVTKTWIEVYDQSQKIIAQTKKSELKRQS